LERALLFHHARQLAHVVHGAVRPVKLTEVLPPSCRETDCDWGDPWHDALYFEAAYQWLAERAGFWPLFLSVGSGERDRALTGYQNQWRRIRSQDHDETRYRGPGEFPNLVLFSYRHAPASAIFNDFGYWHLVLNCIDWAACSGHHLQQVPLSAREERLVLKRSWSSSDWLRKARRDPGSVQAVVPELDLAAADEVWCRNEATRGHLIALGFAPGRVRVQRIRVAW